MARGKYLSLEEALKAGQIDQFCNEYPSEGDMELWHRVFHAMVHGEPPSPRRKVKASQTSSRGRGEVYSGTRTRRSF